MAEDLWNEVVEETTTPDSEETNTADAETKQSETTEPEETEQTQDFSILDALIEWISKEQKKGDEEIVTEPTNFVEEEESEEEEEEESEEEESEEDESEEPLTEEEIEQLDNAFTELETQLSDLQNDMDEVNKELEDANTLSKWYEDALLKLWDHPILWPLNAQLLKWEKLNLPDYLEKAMKEEIDSIPDMWNKKSVAPTTNEVKESLQDRIVKKAQQLY